jgi:TonB family protein
VTAACLAAWSAVAQEAPNPPPEGAMYDSAGVRIPGPAPRWERRPQVTIDDFPGRLLRRSNGSWFAVVACRAERDGRLSDCTAERESEERLGLGRAAVGIVRRGRMQAPIEADATGAQPTVRITITFNINTR